jgi:hypothetical protein
MPQRVQTIREALAVALEGLPGASDVWILSGAKEQTAMRHHLIKFIEDFGINRGVILDVEKDIVPEINKIIAELRGIAIARTKTPHK